MPDGSCNDADVGNWDNQEGYDEERADNEVSANRVDAQIDARRMPGSTSRSPPEARPARTKKEDIAVRRKFL
jgi:hypothetical protein